MKILDDFDPFWAEVLAGFVFFIGASIVLLFAKYIYSEVRRGRTKWDSRALQAAVAIFVLCAGHLIRHGVVWINDVHVTMGLTQWRTFLASTTVIVMGKILVLYIFSPPRWRVPVIASVLAVAATVPYVWATYGAFDG